MKEGNFFIIQPSIQPYFKSVGICENLWLEDSLNQIKRMDKILQLSYNILR